jgi:hypothetical protein
LTMYLTGVPDQVSAPTGPPVARALMGWVLVVASLVAMVAAAVVAFTPFSVANGPLTIRCARPLNLAFAPDSTGDCGWSVARSHCILALALSLLGMALVVVAMVRLHRISRGDERFNGLGQLLVVGLSGLGCLILIVLSIAALVVGGLHLGM